MDCFIIANRAWGDDTALQMGLHTIGRTASEAWSRHIGSYGHGHDRSTLIERWSQKGYGPRAVTVELRSSD